MIVTSVACHERAHTEPPDREPFQEWDHEEDIKNTTNFSCSRVPPYNEFRRPSCHSLFSVSTGYKYTDAQSNFNILDNFPGPA